MVTSATRAAETESASSAMVWEFSGSAARRAASAATETESVSNVTEREMDRWHDTFIYSSGVWDDMFSLGLAILGLMVVLAGISLHDNLVMLFGVLISGVSIVLS